MTRLLAIAVLFIAIIGGALALLWPRQQSGLVLYSAVDYGPQVAAAFTRRTGIPVHVIDLSTGALLAKVSAEGHHPAWTMAWFDGDMAAAALDAGGLVQRHSVPRLAFTALGRSLVPADGSFTPTGLTLAGAFTYHPAQLSPAPKSWQELLRPDLTQQVGMNNPAISGPTYPILAAMLAQAGGWPKGQAFVKTLIATGLHDYTKNANTLAALRSGEIKVALTQSSAAWFVAARDPSLRVQIPDPSFALPSVIVAAKGLSARQADAVARFIRFASSPKIQKLRMMKGNADGYYWPLIKGIRPLHHLPSLSTLHVVHLDPTLWGPRESRINAWFSAQVMNK
jgi:iron(III) transport system substrate-binding protein